MPPRKARIRRKQPPKKKVVKSKTLQKLEKLEVILKKPKAEIPGRWRAWLHKYTFPRKYVLLMVVTGLLGVAKNRYSRALLFTTLGKYFPQSIPFLGKVQLAVGAAANTYSGERMPIWKAVTKTPGYILEYIVGHAVGNPENVVARQKGEELSDNMRSATRSFVGMGLERCLAMAKDAAGQIVDNDDLKDLILGNNVLKDDELDRLTRYIPKPGEVFTDTKAQQSALLWAVKTCELEVWKKEGTAVEAQRADQFLNIIGKVVMPRLITR